MLTGCANSVCGFFVRSIGFSVAVGGLSCSAEAVSGYECEIAWAVDGIHASTVVYYENLRRNYDGDLAVEMCKADQAVHEDRPPGGEVQDSFYCLCKWSAE